MNKETIAALLATAAAGYTVGRTMQARKDQKRISKFNPLMVNALSSLLLMVHTNPDMTPAEIREQADMELAFMKIAMK